jgi:antirestriction protein ArdC
MATGTAYQDITDRIIALLEQGVRPWAQGWKTGGGRPLRHNGEPYRGINTLNLWAAAEVRSFCSPYWMTYRTAASITAAFFRT